jgi:hypothetical protein
LLDDLPSCGERSKHIVAQEFILKRPLIPPMNAFCVAFPVQYNAMTLALNAYQGSGHIVAATREIS